MQKMGILQMQKRRSEVLRRYIARMTREDHQILAEAGLLHMMSYPTIKAHGAMLTALIERWDSVTSTFHLPTGEMTVTLEDVWWILRLSISGLPISECWLENEALDESVHIVFGTDELPVQRGQLNVDSMVSCRVLVLSLYLAGLISGILLPDQNGRFLHMRMVEAIRHIIEGREGQSAWGTCMLAQLYRDMHVICYRRQLSVTNITLLQVWAWEHICVTRPIIARVGEHDDRDPIAWWWGVEAGAILRYREMHEVVMWMRQFDEVRAVDIVWRLYIMRRFKGWLREEWLYSGYFFT